MMMFVGLTAGIIAAVVSMQFAVRQRAPQGASDSAAPPASAGTLTRTRRAVAQLCGLAEDMAGTVNQHHQLVGAVSQQLAPLCRRDSGTSAVVREAAIKSIAANKKLQLRLEDAQRRIRLQVRELSPAADR